MEPEGQFQGRKWGIFSAVLPVRTSFYSSIEITLLKHSLSKKIPSIHVGKYVRLWRLHFFGQTLVTLTCRNFWPATFFEKLNSLSFPWVFLKQLKREKFTGIHYHWRLCDNISYVFLEFSKFLAKIQHEILTVFWIPRVFQLLQLCGHYASRTRRKC